MAVEFKKTVTNPENEFKFSCSYQNISKHICCVPMFNPIPKSREKWILVLEVCDGILQSFTIEQVAKHDRTFHVQYHIFFEDIVGKVLYETQGKEELYHDEECQTVVCNSIPSTFPSRLPQDKLVIKGKFTIFGHNAECHTMGFPNQQALGFLSAFQNNLKAVYQKEKDGDKTFAFDDDDITFAFDSGVLKCHKFVLVLRSPVFAARFKQDLLKKHSNRVPIDDVDIHVFQCFLKFLYTNEIEDKKWENVLSLYQVAVKYKVTILQKNCCQILSSKLDLKNVCDALIFSKVHEDAELKASAEAFILENFCVVGLTDKWIHIVKIYPELARRMLKNLYPHD